MSVNYDCMYLIPKDIYLKLFEIIDERDRRKIDKLNSYNVGNESGAFPDLRDSPNVTIDRIDNSSQAHDENMHDDSNERNNSSYSSSSRSRQSSESGNHHNTSTEVLIGGEPPLFDSSTPIQQRRNNENIFNFPVIPPLTSNNENLFKHPEQNIKKKIIPTKDFNEFSSDEDSPSENERKKRQKTVKTNIPPSKSSSTSSSLKTNQSVSNDITPTTSHVSNPSQAKESNKKVNNVNDPLSKKIKKKTYKCSFCNESFPSLINLNKHNNIFHPKHYCNVCKLSFKSQKLLNEHLQRDNIHLLQISRVNEKESRSNNTVQSDVSMQSIRQNQSDVSMQSVNPIQSDVSMQSIHSINPLHDFSFSEIGRFTSTPNPRSLKLGNVLPKSYSNTSTNNPNSSILRIMNESTLPNNSTNEISRYTNTPNNRIMNETTLPANSTTIDENNTKCLICNHFVTDINEHVRNNHKDLSEFTVPLKKNSGIRKKVKEKVELRKKKNYVSWVKQNNKTTSNRREPADIPVLDSEDEIITTTTVPERQNRSRSNSITAHECGLCPLYFNNRKNLERHIKNVHKSMNNQGKKRKVGETSNNLTNDGKKIVKKVQYDFNINKPDFLCELCNMNFQNNKNLERHVKNFHQANQKYESWLDHGKKRKVSEVYDSNKNSNPRKKTAPYFYRCKLCNDSFSTEISLKRHIKNVHNANENYKSKFTQGQKRKLKEKSTNNKRK